MWSTLTVIDRKERRVLGATGGGEWIFATAALDPKSIDEFIQAEIALSGSSVFRGRFQNPTLEQIEEARKQAGLGNNAPYGEVLALVQPNYSTHPANSRAGTKRSPDFGGTLIVDTRKKIVTVKAYLAANIDEIPRGRESEATKKGQRMVNPQTGEAWYDRWGLLSELRAGTAYFVHVVEESYVNKKMFTSDVRQDIANPENPTKENPEAYWIVHSDHVNSKNIPGKVLAQRVHRWDHRYTLPDSWTIRDGILHKDYSGGEK